MRSTDLPAAAIRSIDDGVTRAMADRIFDSVGRDDLGNPDVTVRVLMEDRFLAREIVPRLALATMLAASRWQATGRAAA